MCASGLGGEDETGFLKIKSITWSQSIAIYSPSPAKILAAFRPQ
jgi:hypothetical protein